MIYSQAEEQTSIIIRPNFVSPDVLQLYISQLFPSHPQARGALTKPSEWQLVQFWCSWWVPRLTPSLLCVLAKVKMAGTRVRCPPALLQQGGCSAPRDSIQSQQCSLRAPGRHGRVSSWYADTSALGRGGARGKDHLAMACCPPQPAGSPAGSQAAGVTWPLWSGLRVQRGPGSIPVSDVLPYSRAAENQGASSLRPLHPLHHPRGSDRAEQPCQCTGPRSINMERCWHAWQG